MSVLIGTLLVLLDLSDCQNYSVFTEDRIFVDCSQQADILNVLGLLFIISGLGIITKASYSARNKGEKE